MKRTVALIIILLTIFTSCSGTESAESIASAFCEGYPLCTEIYSSLKDEGQNGYIDSQMLTALYGQSKRPTEDFALLLYGRVDAVREIGVFVTVNGDERMDVITIATDRIELLSSFAEGEGFVKKYRSVIVYGFVDDAERAKLLLDDILQK